jgi:hypothetical protein
MAEEQSPENLALADVDLDRVWLSVATQVWRRHPSWLERVAARVLRSPGLARALLTTPSLLLPWLLASGAVLITGAAVTAGTGQPVVALMGPGLAGAAIAYSYGPGTDPAWELSRSMAVSDRMVLLVRALAVFTVNAVLGVAASVASSVAAGIAFGWLLPMTAVCALALAAATLARSATVGAAAGMTGWTITVLSSQVATDRVTTVLTQSSLALPYLAFTAGCVAIVLYTTHNLKEAS